MGRVDDESGFHQLAGTVEHGNAVSRQQPEQRTGLLQFSDRPAFYPVDQQPSDRVVSADRPLFQGGQLP